MRCLSLAQAWKDSGGEVTFLTTPGVRPLEERVVSEGMQIIHISAQPGSAADAKDTATTARDSCASWIVVDGYHFGADYQAIIKNSGHRLLVLDDYGHASHYYSDIVLNQNLQADESIYSNREVDTQLLIGTRYSLLRREFLKWHGWKREVPTVARKVLVTLGGGAPDNATLKVVQALQLVKMDGMEGLIVVTGSNAQYQEIQSSILQSTMAMRLLNNVKKMPELMAWADVAIAAAGITAWELAFMGLPSLFIVRANNQNDTSERLNNLGAAINLGPVADLSCDKIARELEKCLVAADVRAEMAHHGRQLIDGNGASRVLLHLNSDKLHIRELRESDCEQLWEWANDPDVRAVSFSLEPISWEKHVEWFQLKLNEPNCVFQIATTGREIPAGQIRYDLDGDHAVVSISLDREFRGKGYGSLLIWHSAQELFHTMPVTTIHAYVKQGNEASVRAFQKAGYRKLGQTTIRDQEAVHLVLSRSGNNAE